MSLRVSYSQTNTFKKCPTHWKWRYKEKYEPAVQGSSLFFGAAVDNAVMAMLEGSEKYLTVFSDSWYSVEKKGKYFQIFDNKEVLYSNNDLDVDVLKDEDIPSLQGWLDELKIGEDKEPKQYAKEILGKKKSKHKYPTSNELRYFYRCCWLSMKRKGELLIELFKKDFYPKITKVHQTQRFERLKDSQTGDVLLGALDFVAEIEGYEGKIIFDLKTSANGYTNENIELSEQLPLYLAMSKGQYDTNLVGYVVLVKNIRKDKVGICKSCGNKKEGRHKTCDAVIEGVRCNGEWEETTELKPELQVIVREKTQEQVNEVLMDIAKITDCMRYDLTFRNLDACNNWYGNKCPYYDACHKNDFSKLRKK